MREVVVVDIGGTHARFAIASIGADGAISLDEPETLHTADHASFQTAWEAFRTRKGGTLPPAVSIAVAGPVGSPGKPNPVIRFTNNPWIIRPALIPEKLGASDYTIVNDFAAVAHAVARADDSQFLHLAGPDVPLGREGTISVLGPGTGLGVAHLFRSGQHYRVQAT
ncbi:MAG: glucokinase, partial [Erythrobacter sp.]|nr:glucokinase [Erythrobacter sp.]